MIYNVNNTTFNSYGLRNGDLVAVVNFVQWFRKDQNDPGIQLYFEPGVIVDVDYVTKFYNFLLKQTDCFSVIPGDKRLPWNEVMLWDFRDIIGDHAVIENLEAQKKKIVVCPIYDAQYHSYRNWTQFMFDDILKEYSELYPDYEKIIGVKDAPSTNSNLHGFEISTDFYTNLYHIMEAEIFIGGDTGTSHFASALSPGPKELIYYYNGRGMIHTLPFYLFEGRGKLKKFWLNCYGTTYKEQYIYEGFKNETQFR